ncbi:MAG: hypothetical protein AAF399_26930 [Bacteroidota bacterium]
MKTKTCHTCQQSCETAYRVQLQKKGAWVFVCKSCCEKHRAENPHYRYGGTWQGYRH